MPLAAAPRLDHVGRDDVDQHVAERPAFRVVLEVIARLVPRERGVERRRQEQVIPVVNDDDLGDGRLLGRVKDEVLFSVLGADVALERELAGDDFLDRDLLVPARPTLALVATRLRHVLRAAQRAAHHVHGLPGHKSRIISRSRRSSTA